MKTLFFILALYSSLALTAQERSQLKGKITSASDELEGIYVINRNTEEVVSTTRGGYFTLPAQANDTLVFSAIQFEAREIVLSADDIAQDVYFVELNTAVHQLDEVAIIDYRHINAESLGLVPKGQKQYTPAEKKLATASKSKMNPMGLDPVFNAISGRTRMLQKAAETAAKEEIIEKVSYLYTEEAIVAQLSIPVEYVRGFLFYIAENKFFAKAMKEGNTTMAKFLMNGLALKYLELIQQ